MARGGSSVLFPGGRFPIWECTYGGVRQTWKARALILQSLDNGPSLDLVLRRRSGVWCSTLSKRMYATEVLAVPASAPRAVPSAGINSRLRGERSRPVV